MAEQDSGEKTEEPTQKRLEKAEEEGQILRSQEFSVAVLVIGALTVLWLIGGALVSDMVGMYQDNFRFDRTVDSASMAGHLAQSVFALLPRMALFFLACLVAAMAANAVLGGFRINPKSMLPKASKLNPFSGLKRIFGKHALYELVKGILKTALILLATVLVFTSIQEEIFGLVLLPGKVGVGVAGGLVSRSVLLIASALVLIALLDVPVKIREHNEKLRMTRQEVKDEFKESEGRPEVRARIRARQREIALNKMMKAIEQADVVVTNPQHFAVALSYTPGSSQAPMVLGKGIDQVALQIRKKAEELSIPVFEAPALARALYFTSRVEDQIPEDLYYAVAEVIAYVFSIGSSRRSAAGMRKPTPVVPASMLFDAEGNRINQ
jgi:flagellar biosynthetic protein FlhB